MLAYVLVRYSFPGRRALSAVVDLPLAIPTLVTGVMLVALYGPNSPDRRVPRRPRDPGHLHADRDHARAARRDAAVRRPQRAAGAAGARSRGGGGGRDARREPHGHVLSGRASRRSAPRSRAARCSRSPGASASSAASSWSPGNIPNETLTAPVFIFQLAEPVPAGRGRGRGDAVVRASRSCWCWSPAGSCAGRRTTDERAASTAKPATAPDLPGTGQAAPRARPRRRPVLPVRGRAAVAAAWSGSCGPRSSPASRRSSRHVPAAGRAARVLPDGGDHRDHAGRHDVLRRDHRVGAGPSALPPGSRCSTRSSTCPSRSRRSRSGSPR